MADKRLLESLHLALDVGQRQPSVEGVAALRAHINRNRPIPPSPIGPPERMSRKRSWLARTTIASVVVAAFFGGIVAAGVLPGPVRDAFHSIGLPVESSTLVEARKALRELGLTISNRDVSSAKAADARALALVLSLDQDEQTVIAPVAHEVHERALELIAGAPDDPIR